MSESESDATVDADTLLVNDHLKEMALDGEVTQLHRGDQYAEEGDRFVVEDTTFEVVEVRDRTLGDLTDEDARREGSPDLEHYRERLDRAHDHFEWDDDSPVVLHRFEPVE